MDVGAWLNSLGLGQYEAAFRENALDADLLPKLTGDDLKEIGVSALGHRKKLLAAIAMLQAGVAAPHEPAGVPSKPIRRLDAERRPITVMFCDLVGSTSLAAKLDAEDWRDLVGGYLDDASRAVTQYGGHVLKKLGDGIMALFGYPQAQENDAERAARAGLEILRALDDLNRRNVARGLPALAARIGLETGPVVVDTSGEVFGDAPNVAARVQSAAEPGTLLVTAGVQRQVAGLFVAEDKGPHELKGVAGRPTLYRLVRASGGGRRIGARSLTPFVGREEELALLWRRWERARGGEGQFVQIVGEPGLGKSRLMEEFRLRLAETPHTWVGWASSQLLQNTPLHPLAEWGRQRFGGVETPPERRLAELEATLVQLRLDPTEHAPLLAPLLDAPLPEGRLPNLTPEELRRKQLAAIVAWILAGARAQPLVLAFEDLHWADPTTVELMKTLAERGATAPLFVLATARPEFRAPWTTRAHHAAVSLVPLDRTQIARMIGAIAERHALTREAVEGVSDRTGGVPLFIEEVTRLMLEGGAQSIPPTLQQSLAARLDRLGEARELAQIGAVLGREFSHALLREVSGWTGQALEAALEKLAEADLLFFEGTAPHSAYRFKHALIQDAAYDSLLKIRRQALHRRAAEALLMAADPQPELVAHHFTRAGERELAIDWWGRAGDAALGRSAFPEAIAHLGKAIELAERESVPAQEARTRDASPRADAASERRTHDARSKYARAVAFGASFAGSGVRGALSGVGPAEEIRADEPGIPLGLSFRWLSELTGGRLESSRALARSILQMAEQAQAPAAIAHAHRNLAYSEYLLGEFAEARHHGARALALYSDAWGEDYFKTTGDDFLVTAGGWLGSYMWQLGHFDTAHSLLRNAVRRARRLDHPVSLAIVLIECMIHCLHAGRLDYLKRAADAVIDVTSTHAIKGWSASPDMHRAWAQGRLGDPEEGLARVRAAWRTLHENGWELLKPQALFMQADLEARAGRTAEALGGIEQGLDAAAELNPAALSSLHRLKGDILAPVDHAAAEAAYREAVSVARSQGSRAFELQAAMPLAKLLQAQGRLGEARDELANIVEALSHLPAPEVLLEEAPNDVAGEAFIAALLPRSEEAVPELAYARSMLAELGSAEPVRRERRDRDIRSKYALALAYGDSFAGVMTRAALSESRAETIPVDAPGVPIPLCFGWLAELMAGRLEPALATAQSIVSSAVESNAQVAVAHALRNLGFSEHYMGLYGEARRHGERALALYSESWAKRFREAIGDDFLVTAYSWLSPTMMALGHAKAARRLLQRALFRARGLNHPASLAVALEQSVNFCRLGRRFDYMARAAEALIDLTSTHAMGAWIESGRLNRAWAWGRQVDPDEGLQQLRASADALRVSGQLIQDAYVLRMEADLDAKAGRLAEALDEIERGLEVAARQNYSEISPLRRLKGELLTARDPAAAEAACREAIRVARSQGALAFELQATLPLIRLMQSQGRLAEAHDELAGIVDAFARLTPPDLFEEEAADDAFIATILPPGEDALPELVEAQALLATLSKSRPARR